MGNQLPVIDPIKQIDQLNVSPQKKSNLEIYVWRADSQTNQHIPNTFLNFPSVSVKRTQPFLCRGLQNDFSSNITFENYVCDFRPLVGFMNLSQQLTLFRQVLGGHKSIYSKFNSTIIDEKCCFLTHKGQARIWINPNYYVNEFWKIPKKQFRLRTSSAHEMNSQTPRFMNKDEFELQNLPLLTSQGAIIRKIIEWMPRFSKKSKQSVQFWANLSRFIQSNILKNCSFEKVERFIHMWAYQKKISIRTNIEDTVKKLIEQGKILKSSEKNNESNQIKRVSTVYTNPQRKQPSKLNLTIDGESDGISVFDIRNIDSQHMYADNQNFCRILGKYSNDESFQFKQNDNGEHMCQGKGKISIAEKKFTHRRKISKSYMHQEVEPMQKFIHRNDDMPSARSAVYQNVDIWSVRSKNQSLKRSKIIKNKLNHSYQYSISLYTSQAEKMPYALSNCTEMNKLNPKESTELSETHNVFVSDNLRVVNNSRPGQILKKGHTKSFQMFKDKNFNENEKNITCKKKRPVISEPYKHSTSEISSEQKNSKELRFLTFGAYSGDEFTTQKGIICKSFQKQNSQNQLKMNLKLYETKRIAARTRQNSSYDVEKTQKRDFHPFRQITNGQLPQKKFQPKLKLEISDTSISPGNESLFKGQASLMVDMKYIKDGIQEEIIRSKRRIRVGGNPEFQKRFMNQECCDGIYVLNHPAQKTPKTLKELFSSHNKLQTSFGSISSASNEFSSENNNVQRYGGILSKMGRSVQFRKVPENDIQKSSEFEIASRKKMSEEMPNFTKKNTIFDHGSKRSMKV